MNTRVSWYSQTQDHPQHCMLEVRQENMICNRNWLLFKRHFIRTNWDSFCFSKSYGFRSSNVPLYRSLDQTNWNEYSNTVTDFWKNVSPELSGHGILKLMVQILKQPTLPGTHKRLGEKKKEQDQTFLKGLFTVQIQEHFRAWCTCMINSLLYIQANHILKTPLISWGGSVSHKPAAGGKLFFLGVGQGLASLNR